MTAYIEKSPSALSGYKLPEKKRFARREPLVEQPGKLSDEETRSFFHSLSNRGESYYQRFQNAKDKLSKLYDTQIFLVEKSGSGTRLSVSLEFLTSHRSLDEELEQLVRAAGFLLSFDVRPMQGLKPTELYEPIDGRFIEEDVSLAASKEELSGVWHRKTPVVEPRTERRYILSENPNGSADIRRAADSAESLLALVAKLRPANLQEDPPKQEKLAEVVPISAARGSKASPPEPPVVGVKAS